MFRVHVSNTSFTLSIKTTATQHKLKKQPRALSSKCKSLATSLIKAPGTHVQIQYMVFFVHFGELFGVCFDFWHLLRALTGRMFIL